MYKKILLFSLTLFCVFGLQAQELERKWQLNSSNTDYLELKEGGYDLKISSDSLVQKGDYLVQDNFLFLFENGADAPTKRFTIETKSDSVLTLKSRDKAYSFFSSNKIKPTNVKGELVSSKGFSFTSIWKGVLGMLS